MYSFSGGAEPPESLEIVQNIAILSDNFFILYIDFASFCDILPGGDASLRAYVCRDITMRAGIIAAGEGSRLQSEGFRMPKPLVPVGGIPLIERLLRMLVDCGITGVSCIVNEYSLQVRDYVQGLGLPIPVDFTVKTTPSSMHSLFALAPTLGSSPFLVCTVDSIFREDELRGFLRFAGSRTAVHGVLAVTEFVDDEHPLYVQVDASNRIRGFSETEHSRFVTGGLYFFSPEIFREIDTALAGGMERLRNFLAHLVSAGYVLEVFQFSKIVDVDHVHDIRVAEELLGGCPA
jgi:NDP-sugar pyrophosphorylase family protein